MELTVDQELQALLPKVQRYTDDELERQLIAGEGPREPLLVWKGKGVIVDGHRRYKICKKHNLPYGTEEIEFKDKEEVKQWMVKNQLVRRNLTPTQFQTYLAELVEEKKKEGKKGLQAQKEVAEEQGVGLTSVRRATSRAKAIEELPKEKREKVTQKIDQGETFEQAMESARLAHPQERVHELFVRLKYSVGRLKNMVDNVACSKPVPGSEKVLDLLDGVYDAIERWEADD